MSKGNKLGIAVSLLSVLVIGGSVYYYNGNVSKSSEKLQQTSVTTTTATTVTTENKLVVNKENVKVSTEVKDDKTVVVTIDNIADRNLTDVVIEANYREGKIAEVLIPTINKGDKKKIELPLENKLNSSSIKENQAMNSDFRMIERSEFTVADSKGEILVSSIKAQEKTFYIDKVKASSLDQNKKDDLIKQIETAKSIEEIEKILKENKILEAPELSSEHVVFKEGESEFKVEINKNSETTTTSTTSSVKQEDEVTDQSSTFAATTATVPSGVVNQAPPRVQPTTRVVSETVNTRVDTTAPVTTAALAETPLPPSPVETTPEMIISNLVEN